MVIAEHQLIGGTEHPAGLVARDVHVLDDLAIWNRRSGESDWDQRARDRIRRAGDDLLDMPAAEIDLVHPQVVARLGVLLLLEDLSHNDLREVDKRQRFHLDAQAREHLGRVLGRDVGQVDEFAQPFVRDLHGLTS